MGSAGEWRRVKYSSGTGSLVQLPRRSMNFAIIRFGSSKHPRKSCLLRVTYQDTES